MPNQYTISPGTIVGNETITGDLDVDTSAAVGFELGVDAVAASIGFNLKKNRTTRFNTGKAGMTISQQLSNGLMFYSYESAAGVGFPLGIVYGQPVQTGSFVNTGDTIEHTAYSSTIRGGIMGAQGVLRFRFYWNTTVQGGVGSAVRVKLGASLLSSIGVAATGVRCFDGEFVNINGAGNNAFGSCLMPSGASPVVNLGTSAVDTTVDQNLAVTVQNGAASDSHQFYFLIGHVIPCDTNY